MQRREQTPRWARPGSQSWCVTEQTQARVKPRILFLLCRNSVCPNLKPSLVVFNQKCLGFQTSSPNQSFPDSHPGHILRIGYVFPEQKQMTSWQRVRGRQALVREAGRLKAPRTSADPGGFPRKEAPAPRCPGAAVVPGPRLQRGLAEKAASRETWVMTFACLLPPVPPPGTPWPLMEGIAFAGSLLITTARGACGLTVRVSGREPAHSRGLPLPSVI